MNILFISQYFYPEPFSNNDIARALITKGHNVDVICCVPNYPEGRFYPGYSNSNLRIEMWKGVRIFRAWTIARGKTASKLFLNYLVYPISALIMIGKHGRHDYSVSFTSMPSPIFQCIVALIIKIFYRVPAVYWVQDIWPESLINAIGLKNRLLIFILRKFCAFLYRRADMVLIQSEAFRSKLESMGVKTARIGFFPNTAPERFAPLEAARVNPKIAALMPSAPLRLMFAGNVGESQNLDIVLSAAQKLQKFIDIQWIIVGSGRDLDRLKKRTADAQLNGIVSFVGRHPMNEMPSFYALADAMIVSLKNSEIFQMTVPYKLQTYMSAGKPVIGSISGETRRIIEKAKIGFCADAEDDNGFCEAILRFAALTSAERAEMSENSRIYFSEHYSPERVFNSLERHLLAVSGNVAS